MNRLLLRKTRSMACAVIAVTCGILSADSNIDPAATGNKFGWTQSGGWANLQGDYFHGVHVGPMYLGGFAWHENFGWINFGDGIPAGSQYSNTSAADFGVNITPSGQLSGYAWGENIGWVNFDTTTSGGAAVTIDQSTGHFTGYAWGENIGWIAFDTVTPTHVAKTVGQTKVQNWTLYY